MRKFKGVVIVLLVVLVGLALYGVSKLLVDNSYSSEEFVTEKTQEAISEKQEVPLLNEEDETEQVEKVFDEESINEETGIAKVEKLYDDIDVDERQLNFLGDRYSDYESVLASLQGMYKEVFTTKVKPIDREYYAENIGIFDYVSNPTLTVEDIKNTDFCSIKESSTVIGLYDNVYVLYAYNFEDTGNRLLFFVDYSEGIFSTDNLSSWDFGRVDDISLMPSCIYSEVVDGYTVIFAKA